MLRMVIQLEKNKIMAVVYVHSDITLKLVKKVQVNVSAWDDR